MWKGGYLTYLGSPPPCKQSLSQSMYTFYRAPPGFVMLHPHASPRSPPQPILIHFDYLSWKSAWILSGRPRAQTPTDPNNNHRFGRSHHWAVTFFFLILLFQKSKESLSVDMVHLYLCQHITSHKWHISYINRPTPDASGATLGWRPIVLLIERFTITFTANGKTSIWNTC